MVAWKELASRSFSRVIISLLSFYISFFWPNNSFYFYFRSFSRLIIYSFILRLLASVLSSSFLYISRSLFNLRIKVLSLPSLFFSSLSSFYSWASPSFIRSFTASNSVLVRLISDIYALKASMVELSCSCLVVSLAKRSRILCKSFYLSLRSELRLWLISSIYWIFLSSTAYSFSNFFKYFFSFSIKIWTSLTWPAIYLYL